MTDIGQGRPWAGIVGRRWDDSVVLEALSQFVGPAMVRQVLMATGKQSQRIRRLSAMAVVWLIIAMALYRRVDIPCAWRQVIGTLHALWLAGTLDRPPCPSAFSAARRRLGARPMRRLFCHTAAPIATDQTRGAFYCGMRLMAIDGVHFQIADTPDNAAAFGRPTTKRDGDRVDGGYPQVHAIGLMELGSHVVCEAVVKPSKNNEYPLVRHLIKSAPQGSLVLWDKGFYGYQAIAHVLDRHVHVLGRVKRSTTFKRIKTFSDGSFLAKIYPTTKDKRHNTRGIVIRVIQYTFEDETRPGHGERHRLFTTLLDAEQYPAPELVVLYHERWEFEMYQSYCILCNGFYHVAGRGLGVAKLGVCGWLCQLLGHCLSCWRRLSSSVSAQRIQRPPLTGNWRAWTQPRRIQLYSVGWGICKCRARSLNHHSWSASGCDCMAVERFVARRCRHSSWRIMPALNVAQRLGGRKPSTLRVLAI